MNDLQLGTFKWEMSKKMSKTLSSLMKEAQRHTIAEALYYTKDTRSSRHETKKKEGGPLGPHQPKPPRSTPNRGKKSVFERYTPLIATKREILNQEADSKVGRRLKYLKKTEPSEVGSLQAGSH